MAKSDTRHLDSTKFTTPGGVNYRVMMGYPIINLSDDGSTATEQYLIKSTDANKFAQESFPPPVVINGLGFRPPRRQMPGTSFTTQSIEFKPFNDDLTWDPIGVYDAVNLKDEGFHPYCLATIEYAITLQDADNEPDPKEPLTFLTRTITAGGEWLSLAPEKTLLLEGDIEGKKCKNPRTVKHVPATESEPARNVMLMNGVEIELSDFDIAAQAVDFDGGTLEIGNHTLLRESDGTLVCVDPQGQPSSDLTECQHAFENDKIEENQDLELPVLIPIHTVEYTIKWEMFLNPQFNRMFGLLGRVNSDEHPIFFYAPRETVLFTGISASQKFVWNGATARAQPWEIEFHFSQRIARDCGRKYGWNHVFAPKKGVWVRAMRANGLPLHYSMSMKSFFGG
jgi:hypothetical protein